MLKRTAKPFYSKAASRKDRDAATASRYGFHQLAGALHRESAAITAKRRAAHRNYMAARSGRS